jgi:uncharacterized membrane protein YidH (DUF202 family)
MKLDVRIPIGLMFSTFGIMLFVYGLISDKAIYQKSMDININLYWGIVLVIFGVIMLVLSQLAAKKTEQAARK